MTYPFQRAALMLVLTAAMPAITHADTALIQNGADDLAIRFIQFDAALSDRTAVLDSTVKRIEFSWREAFGERVMAGLLGGFSYLSQDDNALTAGEQLDGWHAGARLDVAAYRGTRMGISAGVRYVYTRVDEDDRPVPVEYEWSEATLHLTLSARVGSAVTFFGGANHVRLDGEQRTSGVTPATLRFDNSGSGGFLGVDFEIEPRGHIGLIAEGGVREGGQIYFLHRF